MRGTPSAPLIEDIEWLLDMGEHPLMILQRLHRTGESVVTAARRQGNRRVEIAFADQAARDRYARKARKIA